jgi:hypothetical protein
MYSGKDINTTNTGSMMTICKKKSKTFVETRDIRKKEKREMRSCGKKRINGERKKRRGIVIKNKLASNQRWRASAS